MRPLPGQEPSSASPTGTQPRKKRRRKTTEMASTPFHVRFGKMSVLRPAERKVTLHLNGSTDPLPFAMKVGEQGEAFFVVHIEDEDIPDDLVTSPILSATTSPIAEPDNLGSADDGSTMEVALRTVRHVYTTHRANARAGSDTPSPYPSPSPEPYTPVSSELVACRRRNSPALPSVTTSSNRWKCPHCPYVQRNRRSPDLKRHVETHTPGARIAAWVCCGVPIENAVELGVPSEVVCSAPLQSYLSKPSTTQKAVPFPSLLPRKALTSIVNFKKRMYGRRFDELSV